MNIAINTLNANDVFAFADSDALMVVESRSSEGGMTLVTYRPMGTSERYSFVRPGRTTVTLH